MLNLNLAKSHLTREFANPPSENLHQHTMGLLGEELFFSLTQKILARPIAVEALYGDPLAKHHPLSITPTSLNHTFVNAPVQFFNFVPRRGDVELFAESRLSNNAFPDVGTAVDVFNQLGTFVRRHGKHLIVEQAH
jgi:hypothetical protein